MTKEETEGDGGEVKHGAQGTKNKKNEKTGMRKEMMSEMKERSRTTQEKESN